MPQKPSLAETRKRPWWRILLGVVVTGALVVLVVNPELAALGFLFDPILLDVAIVFFSTQLILFNGQIRSFLTAGFSSLGRRLKTVRLKR